MLQRTCSACVTSSDKLTSKKNPPPTVTKEKWDRENMGWLMTRRWVDTADVQCPNPTVRNRACGWSLVWTPWDFLCSYGIFQMQLARKISIVRMSRMNVQSLISYFLLLFVVSGFIWTNLCLQKHADCARRRSLYLRYGTLHCWTTSNLKQRLIFSVSVIWMDYFITFLPEVNDLRKSEESRKEQCQISFRPTWSNCKGNFSQHLPHQS